MTKIRILAFTRTYLPGNRGGGPIRSLANMIEHLGDLFSFRVVTTNRDLGTNEPYEGIVSNTWNPVNKGYAYYLVSFDVRKLRSIILDGKYDILYFNSFFDPKFTIIPLLLRRVGLIPSVPIVLAPRGEFSTAALNIKKYKKSLYITSAKMLGLYRNVTWQASSTYEEADIRRVFGNEVQVVVAPDLAGSLSCGTGSTFRETKVPGRLRLVFLSRISPIKNLIGALEMLQDLSGNVEFHIYGPIEDQRYWRECQVIIGELPKNVTVLYHGAVAHDKVGEVFSAYDLFFFPTFGENFGHVILEALSAGCPVLISDETPWKKLDDHGVGWALPLKQPDLFLQVLQECVGMDTQTHQEWSGRAREFGLRSINDPRSVEQNRQLFVEMAAMKGRH